MIPYQQDIDKFITQITLMNIPLISHYLYIYGEEIVNCLHSHKRLPPLYFAVTQHICEDQPTQLALIHLLIDHGANVSFKDLYGNNLLYHSCHDHKIAVFQYLMELGLLPSTENVFRQTILFKIAKQNHKLILQYLIYKNIQINVNHQDYKKRTAIFYAAEQGNLIICEKLIEKGAFCNLLDDCNKYPATYARKQQHLVVVNMLQTARRNEIEQQLSGTDDDVVKTGWFVSQSKIKIRKKKQTKKDWVFYALNKLKACCEMQGGSFFAKPVNQKLFGINDYYIIIKKPMDFSTIKNKLRNHIYSNSKQFESDMNLIFSNCLAYNGQDHPISNYARQIRSFFQSCQI